MPHRPFLLALSGLLAAGPALAQQQPAAHPAFQATGEGVQIYLCTAADDGTLWKLKAPEASLLDAAGGTIGRHFAGPSWQAADGSTVVGEVVTATAAPRPADIPWLILRAKSHDGQGEMADVSYIVRMATEGGTVPSSGCSSGQVGAEERVPYRATYLFFRGRE
jgi:hypothetical protein